LKKIAKALGYVSEIHYSTKATKARSVLEVIVPLEDTATCFDDENLRMLLREGNDTSTREYGGSG
jgi:hypothetical protein